VWHIGLTVLLRILRATPAARAFIWGEAGVRAALGAN